MTMRTFRRFGAWPRVQHWAVIVLFVLLCVTGLPQRYLEVSWAAALLGVVGGIDSARWIHRAAGLAFTALFVAHVGGIVIDLVRGRGSLAMVPHRQDFRDAITTLRYYIGASDTQARFDRYDYKQKFEYWGMILGSIVVVTTGLVLLYPVEVTQVLPGTIVPVALVAHGYEGLLAFLAIITWHIFNACFTPDVFPMDTSIFTGQISEERMKHEHPLELERLLRADEATPGEPSGGAGGRPEP